MVRPTFNNSSAVDESRASPPFFFRYISGAGDPRTKVHLVLGKSDPNNSDSYKQQSVVIVPADAPGVKVVRHMMVMGYDDAPEGHSEIIYDNVRVPLGNLVLGWGRGFEVRTTLIVSFRASLAHIPADHSRAPRTWADTSLHEIHRCCPNGTGHDDTACDRPKSKDVWEVPLRTWYACPTHIPSS